MSQEELTKRAATADESPVKEVAPDAGDTASESQEEAYFDNDDEMPLLKYARLVGSLPRLPRATTKHPSRPLSVDCTCSAMGKVGLTPEVLLPDGSSGDATRSSKVAASIRSSDLVWKHPHYLLAMGFRDGTVSLVDAHTAMAIAPSDQLVVGMKSEAIVDICFDASGTFLAAINTAGVCAIWELKYTATRSMVVVSDVDESAAAGTSGSQDQSGNPFASFLTNLAAPSSTGPNATTSDGGASWPSTLITTTSSIQVTRISYPASFGRPTALKIDPSYKRKREKAILVGFSGGRLVFTKRGYVFQRRNDMPIYQGVVGADYQGIEAIAWRGSMAAWADANGIKIYDTDAMAKIAHVDRPTGARAVLYPTISSLRPSLLYETSDRLLVAWGDCVMSLTVQETIVNRRLTVESNAMTTAGANGSGTTETAVVKKRTVQGSMAWELDCVACDVVPLDEEHVAILGLVPPETDDEARDTLQEGRVGNGNDLEVQVVSRTHGTITYADALPILRADAHEAAEKESAGDFRLLSSFAIPRMEDLVEVEEEDALNADDQDFDLQMPIFGPSGSTANTTFTNPHTRWSLMDISYQFHEDDDATRIFNIVKDKPEKSDEGLGRNGAANGEDYSDAESVDSDDYSFVLRPWSPPRIDEGSTTTVPPPVMIVCAASDSVLVRTREVDDAISHALLAGRRGLALRRALQHKRHLRRYDLNALIDEYLGAVLRMGTRIGEQKTERDESTLGLPHKQLSIRRLKLAAEAMPMLLGGHVRMWEKWCDVFSRIPGGLFVLREHLPVRDPVLPSMVYENALLTMLTEAEGIFLKTENGSNEADSPAIYSGALLQLLSTLKSWGPVQYLREMIRFYRYFDSLQARKLHTEEVPPSNALIDAERSLGRRLHQTSAGYLQLRPTEGSQTAQEASIVRAPDDSPQSLFALERILSEVASHAPLIDQSNSGTEITPLTNNQAALEACAELNMMRGRYELSLKYIMAIANLYAPISVEDVESAAIGIVNSGSEDQARTPKDAQRYGYVLAMIEYHHLHHCLLDEDFLISVDSADTGKSERCAPPLVSLMRLIGLDSIGDFLLEHCVPPPTNKTRSPWSLRVRSKPSEEALALNTHDTLPINVVAEQLSGTPKLLHWYLHLVFLRKPEMYVKFPSTAVPPKSVTDLHRLHLDLYIKYTDKRDSSMSLAGTEVYNLERTTTPLLSFLKAALPLGGIRPEEVRRLFESQRSGVRQGVPSNVVKDPQAFAIELAYVIEHHGDDSEEEAKTIMDLYLNGCKSLMLAVAFAQRDRSHGIMLWDSLIEYCLKDGQELEQRDGSLFGSLLECAALSGADLAHLVTQIPQGMRIEGLRPRLVAAVADYRLKLSMHKAASEAGVKEKIVLLRELAHRSRRGMRFQADAAESHFVKDGSLGTGGASLEPVLSTVPRPVERPSRYRLSFGLPIR